MNLRSTLDFLLYDWLQAESLNQRPRFSDHSRETFDAVFDTCERIAREKYAPFNRLVDTQEPHFDGEKVILPQATHDAQKAYAESGMLSAAQDYDMGGMQLAYTVEAAANAFFAMASVSIGSGMLTTGNANLLMVHGNELQKEGEEVSHAHLRYIRPFPKNLGDIIKNFDTVVIPEINNGQLVKIIRDVYFVDAKPYNKIMGVPITKGELIEELRKYL